jgi:hypothetical protein
MSTTTHKKIPMPIPVLKIPSTTAHELKKKAMNVHASIARRFRFLIVLSIYVAYKVGIDFSKEIIP